MRRVLFAALLAVAGPALALDYNGDAGTGGSGSGGGMEPGATYYAIINSTYQQPGAINVASGTVKTATVETLDFFAPDPYFFYPARIGTVAGSLVVFVSSTGRKENYIENSRWEHFVTPEGYGFSYGNGYQQIRGVIRIYDELNFGHFIYGDNGGIRISPDAASSNQEIVIGRGFASKDYRLRFDGADGDATFTWATATQIMAFDKPLAVTGDITSNGSSVCLENGTNCPPAGGAAAALASTTGTASGFTTMTSSPTAVMVFDNAYFGGSLKAASTFFVTIVDIPASVVDSGKLDLSESIPTDINEYGILWSSITGRGRPFTPITTFYFEQSREAPRFVHSATNNAFWVAASTDPYFGLMKFSHSVSSESNCGYFPMPAVRDYNTSIDLRLDEFRIVVGTGTDSGAQRYVVAVASKTNTNWLNANWTNAIDVDIASSLGTVSGTERALATAPTLTSWKSIVASGVPWAVKVCRDGDDATNDASSHDSFFSMLTIRAANTNP